MPMGGSKLVTKIFFIVNPVSAGKKTLKEWPVFEIKLKEKGFKFDWIYTEYPEHATIITREVIKSGYDLIVSVGGDGTMNEVLNGFFENGNLINDEAKLAVFARGTGCDFIRSFGIKRGFENFVKILEKNEVQKLDVGKVSFLHTSGQVVTKHFLNISDVGLGGETTRRVNKTKKHLKGFLAFLIGAMLTILKYRNKTIELEIDGKIVKNEKINSVIVANAKYFGGGMYISPNSEVNDGLLDIIIIGDFKTLELIRDFHLIYNGKHLTHQKISHYKAKKVKITSEPVALLEFDGEQQGTTPAEFEIIQQAVKVLI
jgi:YegS/Rv2252/BmrU family lipid kinase